MKTQGNQCEQVILRGTPAMTANGLPETACSFTNTFTARREQSEMRAEKQVAVRTIECCVVQHDHAKREVASSESQRSDQRNTANSAMNWQIHCSNARSRSRRGIARCDWCTDAVVALLIAKLIIQMNHDLERLIDSNVQRETCTKHEVNVGH